MPYSGRPIVLSRNRFMVSLAAVLLLVSCGDDATSPSANPLLDVVTSLAILEGYGSATVQYVATNPQESGGTTPTIVLESAAVPGGSLLLRIGASQNFGEVVLMVEGRQGHYRVVLGSPRQEVVLAAALAQTLSPTGPPLRLQAGVGTGGTYGGFSSVPLTLTPVAAGEVQVSVAWDAPSDVDLYLVLPSGTVIYYGNSSAEGAELDLDSNAGCGIDHVNVENISFQTPPPRGTYSVRVNYWASCGVPATNYLVTVQVKGQPTRTFTDRFTGSGNQGGASAGTVIYTFTY
jgi:hypothetical protein